MSKNEKVNNGGIRWDVFIPAIIVIGAAAIFGIINNEALRNYSKDFFNWSLDSFGWLYQLALMAVLIIAIIVTVSKFGNVRIGGKNAKPKHSFAAWFAMALTGGVATGIVTWGVNEPLIYFGNIWGELDNTGIQAGTQEAISFAMGRSFYNWTFFPYAIYAICGLLVAYLYFNKKEKLTVTATLKPLFGERVAKGWIASVIDTLSMLGLAIGITSGLTMCIILVTTGLGNQYGVNQDNTMLYIIVGILLVFLFTFSSYVGIDKGIKVIGGLNAWFYYGLIALLIIIGPKLFLANTFVSGLGEWFQNFFRWGLDPGTYGGTALTRSWTMFDWSVWVAYAPVTAIFLAMLSYGRTIREYMIVNWILPSVFGLVWFAVWGGNALHMQQSGTLDLVAAINNGGAVMALWEFLKNLPFGLGFIIVPINIIVIIISFVTAADATLTNIGSMCVKDVPIGTEPPATIKVIWGVFIGIVAVIMAAVGRGESGVDGVKFLAAAGGFVVIFIFALQLVSFVKVFFSGKYLTKKEIIESETENN